MPTLLETSERVPRVWKKRACARGQERIDEHKLGTDDLGDTSGEHAPTYHAG